MKKYFIIYISRVTLWILVIFGFTACNLGEIGWPTDSSHNRLFMPLTFAPVDLSTTSVGITFTNVVDAKKYILEISEDSLQFKNIIRRVIIKSDTITPFQDSETAVNILYKVKFTDLNANTRHSARLLAINKDSTLTSKYSEITFSTLAENIFKSASVLGDVAILKWSQTSKVTFIKVTKSASPTINILKDSVINATELIDTTKTVTGLEAGTYYTAKICYQDGDILRVRGAITFKTPGTAGSYICNLKPTDVLADSLNAYLAAGKTNISFILENGGVYNFGSVVIPAGMVRLTFTASTNGVQPVINVAKFSPAASMDGFLFENLKLVGATLPTVGTYLFSFGSAFSFSDFTFSNCSIDNYNSVVYFKNFASSVDNIVIDNCIVSNNGGYGVINLAGSSISAKNVKMTNTTFISLSTQLIDVRTKLSNLEVSNCTFYNNILNGNTTYKLTQLCRFASADLTPTLMVIDKCIFAGNNGGSAVKSISSNYSSTATFSFSSSYRTSDFPVSTSTGVGFTDLKALTLLSTALFVDPNNTDIASKNFSIQSGVSFDGRAKVGDPRWW